MTEKESKLYNIALAGNPNVGKSTIFNALTGSNQHVGNWPGKTVEKKEGKAKYKGIMFNVVDLPGTYSLTAYSMEEMVARDYIIEENPDVVIHVIDSSNLERNLYMTTELLEIGANVVIALNCSDICKSRGIEIDEKKMSSLLKTPIVKTDASHDIGIDSLMDEVIKAVEKGKNLAPLKYGSELDGHIDHVESAIVEKVKLPENYRPRWAAIKLLENDTSVLEMFHKLQGGTEVLSIAEADRAHLREVFDEDVDAILADGRYGLIAGLAKETVKKDTAKKVSTSDKIDKIITHKYFGIPIFLGMMLATFEITFTVGGPLSDVVNNFFANTIGSLARNWLPLVGAPDFVTSLISNGILGGVGTVLSFVPYIFMMYIMIALLEDSGYMARAAFVMDRLMSKVGLHGKSFIPMILGFGCNIPGIMASRTLDNEKDRKLTVLINPFMSCSARLTVYVLFVAAFFQSNGAIVLFSLYVLGIAIGILSGILFRKTILKGGMSPFVMELPSYRMPTFKGVVIHMWERGSLFLKKAGTIIFGVSILIWVLASVPFGVAYASQGSVIGIIGTAIAPVFRPLGFGNWQSSVALTFGFLAKEVVVATMGTIMGTASTDTAAGKTQLAASLHTLFTPLSAYAFLIFVLLYVPCVSAVAVMRREIGGKWALFAIVYEVAVAWVVAFVVYQVGLLLGL